MTILICIAAYLAIGAALSTYWYHQGESIDRAPVSWHVIGALVWPVVLILDGLSRLLAGR